MELQQYSGATINPLTGLATAVGEGTTAITVVVTNNADKSGATATATFGVNGPAAEPISGLSIFPSNQAVNLALPGSPLQTAKFIAIGTNGITGLQSNVTSQVSWSSTNPLIATIDSTGVAVAISQGSTTITAVATNVDGSVVTATANLTVAAAAPEPLLALNIIPGSESVAFPGQTGQFIAIGTFTPSPIQPVTENMTTAATWTSTNPGVATVGLHTGLVTAVSSGTTVLIATAQNPDTSVVTSFSTFTVTNAASEPVVALTMIPSGQSVSKGQTAQFIALGTDPATGLQEDVTTAPGLTWSSSVSTIGTIGAHTGLASGVTAGTVTITAEYTNPDHSVVAATGSLTVTSTTAISGDIISIAIQPSSQTDNYIDQTTQFIAVGTSALFPYTSDITNCIPSTCSGGTTAWASSNVDVATINSTGTSGPTSGGLGSPAGLATLIWEGTTAITATYTNADGSIVTGVATLDCPFAQCILTAPPELPLATLIVVGAGNNTTNWLVTAPSATGVAKTIHCGPADATPGGPVCVGSYPVGSAVTLTTNVTTGSFGGWASGPPTIVVDEGTPPVSTTIPNPSYCTPVPNPSTSTGTNTCSITLSGDYTVVAIFDN